MEDFRQISAYTMAVFYIIVSFSHFLRPTYFLKLLPDWLPFPRLLNLLSGLAELVLGIGLLFSGYRVWASWGVVLLLILSFPVKLHIYQHPQKQTPVLMKWYFQLLLVVWALVHTGLFG